MKTLKIMFADDDKDLRDQVSKLITSFGWEVHTVANGIEAMDKLDKTFDIVVTDGEMPVMDGLGLTASVRNMGFQCPVIMFSASPQLMPEFYAKGGNMFIDKPNSDALRNALEALEQKRAA